MLESGGTQACLESEKASAWRTFWGELIDSGLVEFAARFEAILPATGAAPMVKAIDGGLDGGPWSYTLIFADHGRDRRVVELAAYDRFGFPLLKRSFQAYL